MARVTEARSSSSSSSSPSLLQLFSYADWKDKVLMLLGTMGSIGDGVMHPLTLLVLGSTINSYGAAGTSLSNMSTDKVGWFLTTSPHHIQIALMFVWTKTEEEDRCSLQYALQLLYVAIGVGAAAFLGKHTNSRIYLPFTPNNKKKNHIKWNKYQPTTKEKKLIWKN